MTAEHMWYNMNIYKADNLEKKGSEFSYNYDINDEHFNELRLCAVLNSSAVFSDSLPERIIAKLSRVKKNKPEMYEESLI